MKVAVIGHPIKTNRIIKVIKKIDSAVEILSIEWFDMDQMEELIRQTKECEKKVDAIMLTGDVLFNIISREVIFTIPVEYIPKDAGALLMGLVEAQYMGYGLESISIDSYKEELVSELYKEMGITTNKVKVKDYSNIINDDCFIDDIFSYHYDLYKSGKVSVCLTGVSDVYEMLSEKNIPVVLIHSNNQSIEIAFEKLKHKYMSRKREENDLAVLFIELDIDEDESLINENDYQVALKRFKVSDKVYLFSHCVLGAIIEVSPGNYIIITSRDALYRETENLTNIKLFDTVKNNFTSTISIGIGFGDSAREAKYNAGLGLDKSKKSGGNCAYIVYSNNRLIGPISGGKNQRETIIDDRFLKIAQKSGLSVNTIFKLDCMINRYKKNSFTIKELAQLYGISLRSMYRIIEKLENANYAIEVGVKVVDSSGRPSRIMRLIFNN
ncbi:MAG: hypothetical protein ACYCYE_11990 [Clostridia bacterium]